MGEISCCLVESVDGRPEFEGFKVENTAVERLEVEVDESRAL